MKSICESARRLPNRFAVETRSAASPCMFAANQLGDRSVDAPFDPALHRSERDFLVLKLLHQRNYETGLDCDRFRFHAAQDARELLGSHARGGGQAIGPKIRRFAKLLGVVDAKGELPQRLDQRHPQKQWKEPQLRHRERLRALGLAQPIRDIRLRESVIGIRNQSLGELVDGGETREDFRKIARQMAANLRNLRADQIRIVEQPLGCSGQRVAQVSRFRQIAAREIQGDFVVVQSRKDQLRIDFAAGRRRFGFQVFPQYENRGRSSALKLLDDRLYVGWIGFGCDQEFAFQAQRGVTLDGTRTRLISLIGLEEKDSPACRSPYCLVCGFGSPSAE